MVGTDNLNTTRDNFKKKILLYKALADMSFIYIRILRLRTIVNSFLLKYSRIVHIKYVFLTKGKHWTRNKSVLSSECIPQGDHKRSGQTFCLT